MKGQAYINGTDISTWGVLLLKGTYEALLKPAPMKDWIFNSSRLAHGVEYLERSAKFNSRSISISVLIEGIAHDNVSAESDYLSKYSSFLDAISQGVFSLSVPTLGLTYKLVYNECSSYGDYGLNKGKFTLKLTEPNPTDRSAFKQ